MALDNKIKGILSLISGVLIHLLIGNLFSYPNFIPYYKSYLYHKNSKKENISESQLYFIALTGIFVFNTLPVVTGFLDKIFGIKILTIVGVLLLIGSQFIMYYFIDYYLLIISYALFGLGGSLVYFQSLKNCWKYYPNEKGLISGIIFSSYELSSFIFKIIGDFIIKGKMKLKIGGYYQEQIANKFFDYLKFYIICIIVIGTLSSILCFTYKDDNEKDINEDENLNLANEENNADNNNNDENNNDENKYIVQINEENENIIKENNNEEEEMTLKQILKSLDFYKCLAIHGSTLAFGFLLTNTYRSFGSSQQLNDLGMQILSKIFTLLNTFSRLAWGFIYDEFGFKIPYIILCINQIICGGLIYIASSDTLAYITVVCFAVLSYAGHIILFPNLVNFKFGVENSVIILGISGFFSGLAAILGPILSFFIIKENSDYLKVFSIGVAPTFISLILTLFINFNKKEKKVKNEKVINEFEDDNKNKKIVEQITDGGDDN